MSSGRLKVILYRLDFCLYTKGTLFVVFTLLGVLYATVYVFTLSRNYFLVIISQNG